MKHLNTLLHCALLLGTATAGSLSAAPLGTAFNYQGRLDDNGQPATGIYQMNFALFADSTGGNPLASNNVPSVPVTNGLFNTTLDFSATAFTGEEGWLQITVRTNNNALPFNLLSPRTRLAPTPNALFASTAGTATNVISGVVVKSLNGLRDAVSLVAGPNITLTPSGNSLTVASTGGPGVWSLNGSSTFYNNGRVGIGTNQPSGALHVASGGVAVTGASSPYTGAGAGVFLENLTAGGGLFAFDYGTFSPRNLLLNSPGGTVGIGTLSPSSLYQLDVLGDQRVRGDLEVNNGGNLGLGPATSEEALGIFYVSGVEAVGQQGANTSRFVVKQDGKVGIGTSQPKGKLHVAGGIAVTGTSSPYIGAGRGVFIEKAFNVGSVFAFDYDAGQALPLLLNTPGGNVGIGTSDPQARLDVAGRARVCTLEIYGGCDLAEPFPMKEQEIERGSVVSIDEEHPGRLKLSLRAYDTQVAGIVSGANGINPGISLKQEGVLDQGQNVALTGRVYVKADASHGAIKPGDLLTTSDTPGHAMKVSDHTKSQGAILGKAMSALKEGTGLVLVLVTLQ